MRSLVHALVVVLTLAVGAHAAADETSPVLVRGQVVGADGPRAGADVWLVPARRVLHDLGRDDGAARVWRERLPHAVSAADGSFSLTVDPALLAVHKVEVDPCRSWPAVVARYGNAAAGVVLSERPTDGVVEFGPLGLVERPVVTGRVLDCAGEPVPGARVSVERDGPRHNNGRRCLLPYDELCAVASDDDGRFSLPVFGEGEQRLLVRRDGVGHAARDVELAADDLDVGALSFTCDGHVDVRVVDEAGEPVAGAWVGLATLRSMDVPHADEHERAVLGRHRLAALQEQLTLTDADGRIRQHVSGRFNYSVVVHARGHAGRTFDDVGAGDDLLVELPPLDRTEVWIAEAESGRALVDAEVTARRLIPPRGEPALPLEVLPPDAPGEPHVVLGAGARRLLVSATAPGRARGQAEFPPASRGQAPRVLSLVAPTRLLGLVTDGVGTPVPDARVHLAPVDDDGTARAALHETRSDARGTFAFADVASGAWQVELRAEGFVTARRDVVVRQGVEARFEQTLVPVGRLWGTVDGLAAATRADQRVEVRRPDGTLVRVLATDVQGRFHDDLPPGHYQLLMTDAEPVSVVVPAGQSVRVDLVGPERTELAGRVTGLDVPVEGTLFVVAIEPDGREVLRKSRPFDGPFRVNVSPGRYVLHAELTTGEHARSEPVRVADEGELEVPLAVLPGSDLEVRVVDAVSGAPVPGARIMAVPGLVAGADGLAVHGHVGRHWPHTDGAGRARLAGLPAGAYGFACKAPGYEVTPRPIVSLPHVDVVTVELMPLGYLSGSVRLSRRDLPAREGTPVALFDASGQLIGESALRAGGFTFEALEPGTYRLVVGDEDVRYERHVELRPGVHEEVELLVDL